MSPRRRSRALRAALGGALLCACAGPAAVPEHASLAPTRFAPLVPDEADEAAADLAGSALVGDADGAYDAQIRIERYDEAQQQSGERQSGLAPLAQDVANSAQQSVRGYLSASDDLLSHSDLDPAMRERLEREASADPLERGNQRMRESYLTTFARAFNAVAEPLGQSIFTMALAPIRLSVSVVRYAVELYREDSMPLQRRQALAEWKDFLARYPDVADSPAVAKQVADAEKRWQDFQRDRAVDAAERAQGDARFAEARAFAQRALRIDPDDAKARKIEERASRELAAQQEAATRSVRFELPEGVPLAPEGARELTLALLAPGGDVAAAAAAIPPDSPVADEARFARASAAAQAGRESEAQALLQQVAKGGGTMARHAQVELADPIHNPWPHFEAARRRDRWHGALFVILGGAANLPQATPDSVALWLLDVPQLASTVATLPLRAIELPWLPPPPTARVTAVQARRYLDLHPRGDHSEEARAWLESYEGRRGDHVAALSVAEAREPAPDLEPLRQEAAKQTLEVARKEQRLDLRAGMLDGVVQRFPETKAAGEARDLLKEEIQKATPHRITIHRGFLLENPEVAGPRGFGIPPTLLDGDPRNGELHPDGVALVGGRQVELAFLAASGKESDPPERRDVQLSEEQFARVVASLEETNFRNSLLDSDDALEHDARRDVVFERARLGLADEIDTRPEARADYTYKGMRERYGVVRGRDPWLPFDLVLQGSLANLSLGAFPRWREPAKTPDAPLFQ
ncbi:MAG TPA: hypothetical protein VMW19_12805 [Myxococcota bacterium]|nr:hypothetical protein [Myxococcota bacterium]